MVILIGREVGHYSDLVPDQWPLKHPLLQRSDSSQMLFDPSLIFMPNTTVVCPLHHMDPLIVVWKYR